MSEKDLELKLKIMNYLWRIGYLVFKNVEISSSTALGRKTFTDIDVLGIRFSSDLETQYIVCDCKSGKVKNAERLFWLSGVMKFFNAERGMFIRPEMLTTNYLELAQRLNITSLTINQISELEESYNISENDFFGPFCNEQNKIKSYWKISKRGNKNIIKYLLIDYWKDMPQQQILTLISMYKRIKGDNKNILFIKSYLHSLLAISIINFTKLFLVIPSNRREDAIKMSLLGGKISYQERESILSNFYIFMSNEIQALYNQKYPISKKDFISGMMPIYAKYLVDLVIRICKYPEASILIPRFYNLMPFQKYILNKNILIDDITKGISIKNFTMKPAKDFLIFLERSNIIENEQKNEYNDEILNIEKSLPSTLDFYSHSVDKV